nr:MAG TPA: hypothetical protein [Caudoviricetes sp.]
MFVFNLFTFAEKLWEMSSFVCEIVITPMSVFH